MSEKTETIGWAIWAADFGFDIDCVGRTRAEAINKLVCEQRPWMLDDEEYTSEQLWKMQRRLGWRAVKCKLVLR